ncbi:MAG: YkgJ family cysteine cluster protein [Chloroflexi bacterium]|nr:YkgJ family cysteine cluster protein [Chloroflexota bacterium]
MDADLHFDPQRAKLTFVLSCPEAVPVCQAMCCRLPWDITLTPEEVASGQYEYERICALTRRGCVQTVPGCIHRIYCLKRGADGACIYLGADNLCSIYERRLRICRAFDCRSGWRVDAAFRKAPLGPAKSRKVRFLEALRDDPIFVPHPLLKLHGVRPLPERQQVIFVLEMAGGCGPYRSQEDWGHPWLDANAWRALIALFASKDPLGQVKRRARESLGLDLTDEEFGELLWLLNKQHILVDSRHFAGSLRDLGVPHSG